jgi:hypothetical protein
MLICKEEKKMINLRNLTWHSLPDPMTLLAAKLIVSQIPQKEHHPVGPDGLQPACSKARIYKIIFGCTWEEMNSVRETGKVYILTRLSKLSIILL